MKTVLVISTLDTKGEETRYLRDRIAGLGLLPQVMDISMRGAGASWADIGPERVAAAGGSSLEEIRSSRERARITDITIAGASAIARDLHARGAIDAVAAIGGSTGSLMATEVMRALPFGVPKLMLSSTAALPGLSTRYIGSGDIVLFHSVIEISGVTNLFKNVADRAAGAVAGMLADDITAPRAGSGRAVALTMLGPCEQCARSVRAALEQAGFQVTGFSAAGVCDRAMEEMVAEGFFDAVVDLAPGGVGEHLFGFMRDAGPRRMESAGRMGLPQVISTCSVNHMTLENYNARLLAHTLVPGPPARLEVRAWYNPNLISRWFIVPGIVGLLTLVVTLLVTALSVAREREQGTFDQLLVTPYRPWELLIGKALPGVIIGAAEATVIMLVAVFWFEVPFLGNLSTFYAGLFLFLLSAIGVGLMISSLAVTQQQGLLGAFLFLVPAIILSGFATPILNMPPLVQHLTLVNPMRYFMVIVRGVFLEGTPLDLLLDQLWPLALIGLVNLSLASWLFRRRMY